jgi:hypothetical protein
MEKLVELGRASDMTKADYVFGETPDGAGSIVCNGVLTPRTREGQPIELTCL